MVCREHRKKRRVAFDDLLQYTESQKKYSASDIILVVRISPQMSDVSRKFSWREIIIRSVTDDDHVHFY